MPTSLSNPSNTSLRTLRLTLVFLLAPLFFYGQTLTGLWIGSLSNDSTTVRKDQSFEIALTEYNGKVYGYSRSEFIVDDTLYYIVKRVKGTINGDQCQVEDDEIIAYNFRGKLDKGVKVTSTFKRNHSDTSWYLAGTWKTNATKKYYAVTGKINLDQEKDLTASKIFPHLEELNLAKEVAFYRERTEAPVIVKLAKPEKIKTEYSTKPNGLTVSTTISPNTPVIASVDVEPFADGVKKQEVDLPKTDLRNIPGSSIAINPTHTDKKIAELPVQEDIVEGIKKQESMLPKTDQRNIGVSQVKLNPTLAEKKIAELPVMEEIAEGVKKQETVLPKTDQKNIQGTTVKVNPAVVNKKIAENKIPEQTPVVINKPVKIVDNKIPEKDVVVNTKKPEQGSVVPNSTATNKPSVVPAVVVDVPKIDIVKQAAVVSGRKSEFSQMVSFKSDSLEVSLYDNGEIDGDTVSVFMNGEVILAKQGLKASAIKKTIYLAPGQKEFTLVLFAENLGKYPPNTGLLVVHDGDDVYNLRFSSDLQKNAGIIFRRK